jgi:hypothetical protein
MEKTEMTQWPENDLSEAFKIAFTQQSFLIDLITPVSSYSHDGGQTFKMG